jgi:hypothetical protein
MRLHFASIGMEKLIPRARDLEASRPVGQARGRGSDSHFYEETCCDDAGVPARVKS